MPTQIPAGNYFSTKEAAEALGITEGRVRQMVRWGKVNAIAVSPHASIISEREVNRVLKERPAREAS